jgi:hypothetical protein
MDFQELCLPRKNQRGSFFWFFWMNMAISQVFPNGFKADFFPWFSCDLRRESRHFRDGSDGHWVM